MNNNDILRRLRYAVRVSDERMVKVYALAGRAITPELARGMVGKEGDDGSIYCSDDMLSAFLDGLIIDRRGPPPDGAAAAAARRELTNNEILKKVRIALKLKEADVMQMLQAGGHAMSKSEVSALFRKPEHRHYRACGDQVLRKFLKGLTAQLRGA